MIEEKIKFKIRFLLTGKCTARCNYCHNEGQGKSAGLLSFETIKEIIKKLESTNNLPFEVVLSGGEPTLHKKAKDIARLCKSKNIYVSMVSHIGHTNLLDPILPYLDELKVHLDSFNRQEQFNNMGIELFRVNNSIKIAQKHSVKLVLNHPLTNINKLKDFLKAARSIQVHCKIIELYGENNYTLLNKVNWENMGYFYIDANILSHKLTTHKVYLKRCDYKYNDNKVLFIGSEGVTSSLDNNSSFYNKDIINSMRKIVMLNSSDIP